MHKWAIVLGSGTEGFGSLIKWAKPAIIETGVLRVAGWLVGCLFFCVDVIDGAQPPIIETGVLRVAGWLVGCLFFCVDLIDGAQQCSVLQAIRGDILWHHPQALLLLRGVRVLVLFEHNKSNVVLIYLFTVDGPQ